MHNTIAQLVYLVVSLSGQKHVDIKRPLLLDLKTTEQQN